jgi:hypothetical protein
MSMKKSIDTIRNRTHGLPVSSGASTTMPLRAPHPVVLVSNIYVNKSTVYTTVFIKVKNDNCFGLTWPSSGHNQKTTEGKKCDMQYH